MKKILKPIVYAAVLGALGFSIFQNLKQDEALKKSQERITQLEKTVEDILLESAINVNNEKAEELAKRAVNDKVYSGIAPVDIFYETFKEFHKNPHVKRGRPVVLKKDALRHAMTSLKEFYDANDIDYSLELDKFESMTLRYKEGKYHFSIFVNGKIEQEIPKCFGTEMVTESRKIEGFVDSYTFDGKDKIDLVLTTEGIRVEPPWFALGMKDLNLGKLGIEQLGNEYFGSMEGLNDKQDSAGIRINITTFDRKTLEKIKYD